MKYQRIIKTLLCFVRHAEFHIFLRNMKHESRLQTLEYLNEIRKVQKQVYSKEHGHWSDFKMIPRTTYMKNS